MVTQEDVELAYQEAMMNMARLNRTGKKRCVCWGDGGEVMGFSNSILNFISLPWGNVTQLLYPFLLPHLSAVQCLWNKQIKIKRPFVIIQHKHKCCWRWLWLMWVLQVTTQWVRGCFKGKYIGFVPSYLLCLENSWGLDCNKVKKIRNRIKKETSSFLYASI